MAGHIAKNGVISPFKGGKLPKINYVVAIATTLLVAGTGVYTIGQVRSAKLEKEQAAVVTPPEIKLVTALGRLEPVGEVVKLSAPSSIDGTKINQILVKEGDRVKIGQAIAILDSRDRLQAALEQAQEQVRVAKANLDKVKAGAKQGEIEAQQATIARLETERKSEIEAQQATIARLEAERKNDITAQQATIDRLEAEQKNEIEAQQAIVARLAAEKKNDIAAQQATIARLQAEFRNAQLEYQRYEKLYQEGAFSASVRDSKRLNLDTAQQRINEAKANLDRITSANTEQIQEAKANLNRTISSKIQQINEAKANLNRTISVKAQQLNEAKANLNRIISGEQQQIQEAKANLDRIVEIRPEDIAAAAAELSKSEAAVKQAKANLDNAYVRSPRDAQILKIHARSGEIVTSEGIAELGETNQMYAVAEVYESDINKIKIGQQAQVTSDSIPGELQGTVEQIGLQVKKQNVINTDTSANIDSRIIEVKVRLDSPSSQKVAGLTNLQVKVAISL